MGRNRDDNRSRQSRSRLQQWRTVVRVSVWKDEMMFVSYASETLLSVIVTLSGHSQGKIGRLDVVCRVRNIEDSITSLDADGNGQVLADSGVCAGNQGSKSCSCERFSHNGKRTQHDE